MVREISDLKFPPYFARVDEVIPTGKGTWDILKVGIYEWKVDDEVRIGSYSRNYLNFYRTFFPFRVGNQWFALYSRDYTCTRLMSLPDCTDIGGEEPRANGFCPVEYYVPHYVEVPYERDGKSEMLMWNQPDPKDLLGESTKSRKRKTRKKYTLDDIKYHEFGFVAGCVWGDDWSWKIQFLDLSRAKDGVVSRTERFGYISLPTGFHLIDAISLDGFESDFQRINIAVSQSFDLDL